MSNNDINVWIDSVIKDVREVESQVTDSGYDFDNSRYADIYEESKLAYVY